MKSANRLLLGTLGVCLAAAAPAQFGAATVDTLLQAMKNDELSKIDTMVKANRQLVNGRAADGETPLMLAIEQRSIKTLGFLLFYGADPNAPDGKGQVPMIAAARIGWAEGVEGLMEMDAAPNVRNRQGETPLIAAVQARNARIVRQLLAKGADPDLADHIAGYSARDYAKRDTRTPQILRLIEAAKPAN